jgi:geranylgeranyl pyrophosphate synthase
LMRLFSETLAIIVNGEIDQLFTAHSLASRESYLQRIYAKTASMFELATGAAALLSPVDDHIVDQARAFGYEIGLAFQIVDDVLDFTGEQTTVGKPVANDLRQGIFTLPALYYLEAHPDDKDLKKVLDGNIYDGTIMDRLVESIRQSGAIELSLGEAKQYVDRGLAILSTMPDGLEHDALQELSAYILNRNL